MKNPLRSPLLWGTYEVLYASKASAVGGPLTQGVGPVLAQGQRARQILQDDGSLINEVSFKTLGFVQGSSRQFGQIKPLSGDTFLVRWRGTAARGGQGGGLLETGRRWKGGQRGGRRAGGDWAVLPGVANAPLTRRPTLQLKPQRASCSLPPPHAHNARAQPVVTPSPAPTLPCLLAWRTADHLGGRD